ncbi:ribonucleotide reductase of class Ib (aerobic), beta subunit [Mycoplasma haemofelis str. Langford 1]|uniref:Ribonucleoside-diphosphate reductase subunit beta n=1 Tax=Mycoplasma haemofelis (strain Langford 1) TaxID=941640 RepID=E8ZKC0_MYCHL|nr:class 1b ribonucleoside-diphosphate reductase subunit beta [Mycoplasma haemofelis]CBY92086.1 ribonucleotide reductase of class Ib (aerobic), beta subunit [Mycoplasma haemofelis str. Langford 1]
MFKKKSKFFSAVNWNNVSDKYSKVFWNQNVRQFWIDEEIPLSGDKLIWAAELTENEKDVYKKVLVGLTLLDTHQGSLGMTNIAMSIDNPHATAVLQFMGMMEQMHAKSYSTIFSTLATSQEIEELFKWSEQNPELQKKMEIISHHYENIQDDESLYMAMVASVFLESFLFYSGFYYMLLLAGKGMMINSGEIINLIIRDEAIHGLYIGVLSMEIFKTFNEEKQKEMKEKVICLLRELMANEIKYTELIYSKIGLVEDVNRFLEYNANKALQNLGFENEYSTTDKDINPIVFNGLKTTTKSHDFFSTKGNGYIKTTKVEEIKDEDFFF